MSPVPYKIFLRIAVVAILLIAAFWGWLMTGPHSISRFNGYIEEALTAGSPHLALSISESTLQWDGWQRPFAIHLLSTTADHETLGRLVELPEVVVTINPLSLLRGELDINRLIVENPSFYLIQTEEGSLRVGSVSGMSEVNGDDAFSMNDLISLFPGKSLSVHGASLFIQNEQEETLGEIRQVNIEADIGKMQQLFASMTGQLHKGDMAAEIKVFSSVDLQTGTTDASGEVNGINPSVICSLLSLCQDVPHLDIPLSGPFAVSVKDMNRVTQVKTTLKGEEGTLYKEGFFPEMIPLKTIAFELSAQDHFEEVSVSNLTIDIDKVDTKLWADATLKRTQEGVYVDLTANAENMPPQHLYRYWPIGYAPQSRDWTITSIKGGMATKADVTISLKPEDFDQENLPSEFLKASVTVRSAEVNYLPGFPKAKEVDGTVYFTGDTMRADITNARALKDTAVKDSMLTFTDLNHPNVPIEIDLKLTSSLDDILEYVNTAPLPFELPLPMQHDQASGPVSGSVKLGFDSFSGKSEDGEPNFDSVIYEVAFDGQGLAYTDLFDGYSVTGAKGLFAADSQEVALIIDGALNGVSVRFDARDTPQDQGIYNASFTITPKQAEQFGSTLPKWIESGVVACRLTMQPEGDIAPITAELDLTDAVLSVADIQWTKPAGTPAKARLSTSLDSQYRPGKVVDVTLESGQLSGNATVTLDQARKHPLSVYAPSLIFNGQRIALRYKQRSGGEEIAISGRKLDLSPFISDEDDMTSISDFPAIRLEVDIGQLTIGENRQFYDAKGTIDCLGNYCRSADLSVNLDPERYHNAEMRIYHEEGKRFFVMQSTDAGNFLRKADILDNMYGGTLQIKGEYDDRKPERPLVGRAIITNYTLRDAPVLGKLLNLMSLPGLFDALSGKGISFSKLGSDFVFANDLLAVKDARSAGPSLGILAEGTINLNNTILDIEGSIVPAYALNSFFSHIPLIGQVLTGGEGEGVFAFNYSVSGPYEEAQVMVNPLSVLTPGFTRKFFDMFDQPVEGATDTD